MERRKLKHLVFFAFLINSIFCETKNPLKNPHICGLSTCVSDNEKFNFLPSTIYTYSYESSFNSLFDGTDNPSSDLFISAELQLTFPTKCQGQLKVTSVQLKNTYGGSYVADDKKPADYEYEDNVEENTEVPTEKANLHPKSKAFAKDIEETDIRFDFHDGEIGEICPNPDEPIWVTNFKRGIVSMFQNTMPRFDLDLKTTESDVSGKCRVEYQFQGSANTSIEILKVKDVSSCQNRNKFKSIIQTTPYSFGNSDISWWPIYSAKSSCKLSIDNFIYSAIECSEDIMLIPFSNGKNSAKSQNTMKIKLLSENPDENNDEYSITKRKPLVYDHSFSPKPTHNEIKLSRDYLKKMCSQGFPNISRDWPEAFVKFLSTSKQLSIRGLQQLWARSNGVCSNGRRHVLDSLPFIGSSASIELMKDLILSQRPEISQETKEAWMISMFYLPRPEKSAIQTMDSFIKHYENVNNPSFILIPTAVVSTYCKHSNLECKNEEDVMNIVQFLQEMFMQKLQRGLSPQREIKTLLIILKGLGNIGIVTDKFQTTLKGLLIDEYTNDDLKLQIIDTFRKLDCDKTRDFFMDIYKNFTQSVEVRISSYQQFMKCPNYMTVRSLKEFLKDERVNQVGSYVWSHLQNLIKTSFPQKIELQGLLLPQIDDQWKKDFRKYSRNFEYSLFFEEYNFGVSGESNCIFGIDTYLPSSLSFNGTVNLFGNSANPVDMKIRMKGMEKYIESIFGLNGPLNLSRLIDNFGFIYEKIRDFFDFDEDFIETLLRSRRSASSGNLLSAFPYNQEYQFDKPMGYFEQKVFGNDIMFESFEGLDELSDIIKKLVPIEQMKNIFSKKEEHFIKSGTIVDVSYTVPMLTGFPLILDGLAAYSLDLRYYGSIQNDLWKTKTFDFDGKLRPSFSMELSTTMQIDLFHASTDVKVKSNIYSNYAIEVNANTKDGTHASLKVQLPQDRNDILSVRSQMIAKIEGKEELLYGIPDRWVNSSCSWPSIETMIGLKLCVDYSVPDLSNSEKNYPSLILSGPNEFDIHLDKSDLSAKVFKFDYLWTKEKSNSIISITFETPMSKVPRKLSSSIHMDSENYNLTMEFRNGAQTQTALGFLKNAVNDKLFDFSVNINGNEHLSINFQWKKSIISKSRSRILPSFLLTINGQKIAGLIGSIKVLEKNNISQYDFDLGFETKRMMSSTIGHLIRTGTSIASKMQYTYKFSGKKEETIEIDTELANRSQKVRGRTEYIANFKFISSAYSNYNFNSFASFISSLGHLEMKFDVNNAPDLLDPQYTTSSKITLAKNTEDSRSSRTVFSVEVTRPKSSTDLKFHVKYDENYKNGTEHNMLVLIRYSPNTEVAITGSVLLSRGSLYGIDAMFSLSLPELKKCSAAVKIKEKMRNDYHIDLNGEWFNGENIKFVGSYQDKTSAVKKFYKLKSIISSKLFNDINCDFKYSRDIEEMKAKLHTEYNKKVYSLLLETSEATPQESHLLSELNWADHLYTLKANSSSKENGRLKVEVHFDRIRDLQLEMWGIAKRFSNNFGLEFKWDANRDPSQKFLVSYDLVKTLDKKYGCDFLISYPERTINFNGEIVNENPYSGNLKISWSADDSVDVLYSIGSETDAHKKLWAIAKVETPFVGWRMNKINGTFLSHENMISFNIDSIFAETQTISTQFFINYLFADQEYFIEGNTGIQSTIKDIPIVFASIKYNQTYGTLNSEIFFKHKNFVSDDFRVFSLKSLLKSDSDSNFNNISGSVQFKSPLENYQTGVIITKFSLTRDREIMGIFDMDVDSRYYTFTIEGYLRKILDNMISFELTTPIEGFPYILGNFGVSEAKRHLIADLKTSNKSIGTEILFDFVSITNFDIKFYLATPQEAFEKISAIGKIKDDSIHIEGQWNKVRLGFKGVWRFLDLKNFEYSYLIFTPLMHFEENGLVTRLVVQDIRSFDIETFLKLGKYKLGTKIFGEPRTHLINKLGLQKASYIRDELLIEDFEDNMEPTEQIKETFDLSKLNSVTGHFEFYFMIVKYTGNYEVKQIEDTYHGEAKIFIAENQQISVRNKFVMKDSTDIKNTLTINTPFKNYETIMSNFGLKVPEAGFISRFDVITFKGSNSSTYGIKISYTLPDEDPYKVYDMKLTVLYPLENSSKIKINSKLKLLNETLRLAVVDIDGFNTVLKIAGENERLSNETNISFEYLLSSPSIEKRLFKTYLRKLVSENNHQLKSGFNYMKGTDSKNFDSMIGWKKGKTDVIIDGNIGISTNVFPVHTFNSSIFITEGTTPEFSFQLLYEKPKSLAEELKFNIALRESNYNGEIKTPFKDFEHLLFKGALVKVGHDTFKTTGNIYKNLMQHSFEGDVTMSKTTPVKIDLIIKESKTDDLRLSYSLTTENLTKKIRSKIFNEKSYLSFESEFYTRQLHDWAYNIKVQSSKKELEEVKLSTSLSPHSKNQYESSFEMITPWDSYMIDKINVSSFVTLNENDGNFKLSYKTTQYSGKTGLNWKWLRKVLQQSYNFKIFAENDQDEKFFDTEISFSNSTRNPTEFLFRVDSSPSWSLNSKGKFDIRNAKNMNLNYELNLPEPLKNTHKITAYFNGKEFPPKIVENTYGDMKVNYENQNTECSFNLKGAIEKFNNFNNKMTIQWNRNKETKKIDSDLEVKTVNGKTNCSWELMSPMYEKEKSVDAKVNFFTQDEFKVIHAKVHSPKSHCLEGDIAFSTFSNMKGYINSSIPMINLTWFDLNFDFDTQDNEQMKFLKASWPENSAYLDSKSSFVNQNNLKEWKGTIRTEIPLYTNHSIQITYGLEEKQSITTGDANVEYNTKTVLNTHYTSKTENLEENESRNVINLSVENEIRPIGILYILHSISDDTKELTTKKHLELFDLSKENRFNLTGELLSKTSDERQSYKLTAIHPNRTISLESELFSKDEKTVHKSRIELADNVWLGYELEVLNHTSADSESQEIQLKISYPRRNVSIGGLYVTVEDSFDSNLTFQWWKKPTSDGDSDDEEAVWDSKSFETSIQWKNHEKTENKKENQTVSMMIKHPSFEKDVNLQGSYFRDQSKILKLHVSYDYSEDTEHAAVFSSELRNWSDEVGYKNYTVNLFANHPASELNFVFDSSIGHKPNIYKMDAFGSYKRGYLPEMEMDFLTYGDLDEKEIKFYRTTPNKAIDVFLKAITTFPRYEILGNYIDSPEFDSTGKLGIDLYQKHILGDLNFTSDGSQNLQVKGVIPDTRSASFYIWRNYEDVRIDDIGYFIQMNHSRLITSKMLWRPKLKNEVKESIKAFITSRYYAFGDELDYWVRTFYTETTDTIKGIWDESKPYVQELLNDLNSKEFEEDFSSFRNFLNESFHNDDFYCQSFLSYTYQILDDLAIKDHLQTIPKIFKEMWEVLGESSAAFKNSITSIIETIKESYKESIEMFNQIMQGNSLEYLTRFMEIIIEKYDRFVKDLHVSFISYVETMYDNLMEWISTYWNRVLQNIEPQIIRSIHYVESILWGISNEVFDFMYNRTNELIESPYFTKVSNITHDLDVLYQDLQNNDIFTNLRKYSGIMLTFVKEKVLSMIPFGKEVKEIFSDISNEFKELEKIEAIQEITNRYAEIKSNLNWIIREFQLEKRFGNLLDIIKFKLSRITQNALQTEENYLEAKTKFLFDPEVGVIEWQQKLPISWHSFNETPHFEEIPEYKLFNDIQNFLLSKRNDSIWTLYYGLKPLSEPTNLLPPFDSYSLLIGSRHVVSFDRLFIDLHSEELDEMCSYLLAHDFVTDQFTIILKSSNSKKILVVKSGTDMIELELGNPLGSIKSRSNITVLPESFGELVVMRELNIVTITSRRGIRIECNLEFDLCSFKMSGWYFGKIAGILGKMNNEEFDDMTKSDNQIADTETEFVESWRFTSTCDGDRNEKTPSDENVTSLTNFCRNLFKLKTSYFSSCFSVVNPDPFYNVCINLELPPGQDITDESLQKIACVSGVSYIEACGFENIPLRVPDTCIRCELPNGTFISEGAFVTLHEESIQPSVDVVFVMEARDCNIKQTKKTFFTSLVSSLALEYKQLSITDLRFAVLPFGGSKEFQKPRSLTMDGKVFTDAKKIQLYFNHLKEGNGTTDVFTALTEASRLVFKPGAAKTIILSLCSKCEFNSMKFDFKSVSQLLEENDITLHVLSEESFSIKKALGIDSKKAFTRKDQTKLVGDEGLKKQVASIKSLGQCQSLAFETNGSIFSSKTTNTKNNAELKMIASVFAKRISSNSKQKSCEKLNCECEGHNHGSAYLTCFKDCDDLGDTSYENFDNEDNYDV